MQPYPARPRSKKKYMIIAAVILVIAAAIYFSRGLWSGGEDQQAGGFGMPVEMATVTPRTLDITIDSVGTLAANESVILRPEIAGRITDILFTEGQPVKKGEPLFRIDDRLYQAELKQASANLQLANLNYARFAKLSKTGAATKQRFDEARANLGVAQANHDMAKTQVDYTRITAPFDGVVGLRKVSPGDYVNIGQELANFVSYDPMKVDFSIPETQANLLQVGQQIDISVEALPGETFTGNVYALDPQLDVSGRAVSLRATIPNPQNRLKPGYFARVQLTVERKENALVIPEAAIVPQGDAKFVYKVGADETVALTPVTLGKRLEGEVEILQGLAAGDRVVTSGQIKLHPGAKVTDMAAMQKQMQQPAGDAPPAAAPAAAPAATATPEPAVENAVEAEPQAADAPPASGAMEATPLPAADPSATEMGTDEGDGEPTSEGAAE